MKANYHLSRVMGETVLTRMEFTTLLSQIETMHRELWVMLNSLPLTLSEDPSELNILTLGYYLIGTSMATVLENNHLLVSKNLTKVMTPCPGIPSMHLESGKKGYRDILSTKS